MTITTIMLAVLGLPALLVGWALVQQAWRRHFIPGGDQDALAMRGQCGRCSCTAPCSELLAEADTTRQQT